MPVQTIRLVEYRPTMLPADRLSLEQGRQFWQQHGGQIAVDFPSPKTDHQWQFTSLGWVGQLPVTADLRFDIQPKVPLHNLLAMLAEVYDFHRWQWLAGTAATTTLAGFAQQLAHALSARIQQRQRRGLYRAYCQRREPLQSVRGRVHLPPPAPTQVALWCEYEEQTADVPHNQILADTLWRILRSQLCDEATPIQRTYHRLPPLTPTTWTAADLDSLTYNRLNEDYRPLHALCRFFLEATTPTHHLGEQMTLPFLVELNSLFERFVAAWLKKRLPAPYTVRVQESLVPGHAGQLRVRPDLIIYHERQRPLIVLDTKYKAPEHPAPEDIYQVAFYASNALQCGEAVLVYPHPLTRPLDEYYQNVHVRTLPFALDGDLESAGQRFLHHLLPKGL